MKSTYLFINTRYLNVIENAFLTMRHPRFIAKSIYRDPADTLVSMAWGYPFVFYNEKLRKYIMLYQGWSINKTIVKNTISLAAQSDDGISFAPLDMTGNDIGEKRIVTNQVLPLNLDGLTFAEAQFFYLDELKSKRKYIALCIYKSENNEFKSVIFSSYDGLKYQYETNRFWHEGTDAPDYPMSIVYQRDDEKFYIFRRPRHVDRRIAVSMTRNFKIFSKPHLVFQSDVLDGPLTDLYGMTAFKYHGQTLGFLMTYHTPNYLLKDGKRVSGLAGHKFWGGRVIPQLVTSIEHDVFQRGERRSMFGLEKKYPCIYPTCVIENEKSIDVYASFTEEEHGYTNIGRGAIGLFKWRKDGFACLHFDQRGGSIVTKQFLYHGEKLRFNIKCQHGFIKLQLSNYDNVPYPGFNYENCQSFSGDDLDHEFQFENADYQTLKGQIVVINLQGQNADLFSISGDIEPLTPYQAMLIYQKK